jgi:hypothetical protein
VLIAMGHLNDPSNTFWELFLRRTGSTSWVLHTPPGVASNGGLVVANPPTGPLTVGFLASAALTFSPVAETTDGGEKWSSGELPSRLTAVPDALAVNTTGQVAAVVSKGGRSVLSSSGDLSSWRPLISAQSLKRSTSGCALKGVTAVAYTAVSQPVLGIGCARAGGIGIITPVDPSSAKRSGWHDIGPSLGTGRGAISVTRLEETDYGLVGLAQVRSGKRVSLVAFWGRGSTDQWSQATPVSVPSGWVVEATATGGGNGQGVAVLLAFGDRRRIVTISGPGSRWRSLSGSPRSASGVAIVDNEIDTFVVSGSHLAVWASALAVPNWRRTASISVPVPYGSSS